MAVGVGATVAVGCRVGLGVDVAVGTGVGAGMAVAVAAGIGVGTRMGVAVAVGEGVGAGVGLASIAIATNGVGSVVASARGATVGVATGTGEVRSAGVDIVKGALAGAGQTRTWPSPSPANLMASGGEVGAGVVSRADAVTGVAPAMAVPLPPGWMVVLGIRTGVGIGDGIRDTVRCRPCAPTGRGSGT